LNAHWGGPELKNKTRALQNCCGGSGVHGLFIMWRNAARFEDGTLSVNMHLDKKLPQAEIRCEQPYRGVLRISLSQDCKVKVRIPDFASAVEIRIYVNGNEMPNSTRTNSLESTAKQDDRQIEPAGAFGNYLELGRFLLGDQIVVTYPLPITTEEMAVGNPGFRQWRYRVTWKGDTVVGMEPLDNDQRTAYSDFDKIETEVYYGKNGPSPLYQRDHMLKDAKPAASELHADDGSLDFWKIG